MQSTHLNKNYANNQMLYDSCRSTMHWNNDSANVASILEALSDIYSPIDPSLRKSLIIDTSSSVPYPRPVPALLPVVCLIHFRSHSCHETSRQGLALAVYLENSVLDTVVLVLV